MKLPTMNDMLTAHAFELEVAHYHGANSVLNLLHKQMGDNPAVAAFVAAVEGSLAAPIGIQVCRELSALHRPQGDR